MKNRTALLVLSFILALATAGGALLWLKGSGGDNAKKVEMATLLVAKEAIPAGTQITDKMLEKATVPKASVMPDVYNTSEDIVGKYARDAILKGESFPMARVYSDADKLLSMRLEPGYRAFSVAMTQFGGVGDLVKAGDFVDVFVFLKEIEKNQVVIRPNIARVLLQNTEVLSVRKETQKDTPPPEELPELYAVTLAVQIKDIERLILAEETGVLKMALRPVGSKDEYSSYGVIWEELLTNEDLIMRNLFPEYGVESDPQKINTAVPNQTQPAQTVAPATPANPAAPAAPVAPAAQTQKPDSAQSQTPAAKPVVKPTYKVYTVQPGDTLMSISRQFFNGSASYYDDIMKLNNLKSESIKPGQKLKIPTGR